jgi:hypothetical protein
MTLNELAQSYCDSVNKPFDVQFLERIKFAIKGYRAALIRQDFERNGMAKDMLQSFVTKLVTVDEADNCIINVGCTILRTEDKVPKPVQLKGGDLFNYVGSVNIKNQPFVLTDTNELQYTKHKKYTKNSTRYIYRNGYIYIYTTGKFKYITIEGVFENPEEAMNLCANNCPDDNDQFPISAAMLEALYIKLANAEMRNKTEDLEVSQNPQK